VELNDQGNDVLELHYRPRTWAAWCSLFRMLFQGMRDMPCAQVKFDRSQGRRPRFFVSGLPGQPPGQLPEALRKPRLVQDIAAVELAPDSGDGRVVSGTLSGPTCRLRLRLHDTKYPVLELVLHAEAAWARQTGERLARFLGVPLEDNVRPPTS
jgi:hypothetical protein